MVKEYDFNVHTDEIKLNNGLSVKVTYGLYNQDSGEFRKALDMFNATHRLIQLFGSDGEIIEENVVENPYFV